MGALCLCQNVAVLTQYGGRGPTHRHAMQLQHPLHRLHALHLLGSNFSDLDGALLTTADRRQALARGFVHRVDGERFGEVTNRSIPVPGL